MTDLEKLFTRAQALWGGQCAIRTVHNNDEIVVQIESLFSDAPLLIASSQRFDDCIASLLEQVEERILQRISSLRASLE